MKRIYTAVPREGGGWKIIEQMIVNDVESEEILARSLQAKVQTLHPSYTVLPPSEPSVSTE